MNVEDFNELMDNGGKLEWRCNFPQLVEHYMSTNANSILKVPTNIMMRLMCQVAERVVEIQDPVLLKLMLRLTLITVDDEVEGVDESWKTSYTNPKK